MVKRIIAVIITIVICLSMGSVVFADGSLPNNSFTHLDTQSGTKLVVPMPDAYQVTDTINARSLGLSEGFGQIVDITSDEEGNIYILTIDSRLLVVTSEYKFKKEIIVTDTNGESIDFSEAKGLLVRNKNEIYIADTVGGRVLGVNGKGKVIREITEPDSELLPDDFIFAPFSLAMDSKGTLYVLSDGAYYGALLFDKNSEFIGFYGANSVKASPLTTLGFLWDKLTKNDTKRKFAVKKLPFQFLDMYIDSEDFVYTCTGRTNSGIATGQIRKLSPSGTNILHKEQWNGKRVESSGFNFGESSTILRNNKSVIQNFVSVQVDEEGYFFALDNTYGIIYVYDSECTLITAFGGGKGKGERVGSFINAVSICYDNGKLYVADDTTNMISVFTRTEFGKKLFSARTKTLNSKYLDAKSEWQEVLKEDAGNRLAYCGLAKAAFWEADYELAMEYAKKGYDFVTYGQAKEKIGSAFIQNNFFWIFFLVLIAIAGILLFIVYTVKNEVVLIKNQKVRVLFNEILHPFDTFNAIKYKNMGSMIIAIVLLVLYLLSAVIMENYSNFRYTTFNSATTNSLFQLAKTVGFIVLATVANWGICVLLEGKGKLKNIFIVLSYATLPLIVCNFLSTAFSYWIVSPDSTILGAVSIIGWIIAGIVISVGLMITHEYSFPKFLASVVLTVLGMILIVFIIFMVAMLVGQLGSFITNLFMEAVYR